MELFHGTNNNISEEIISNRIDVTFGGGEIGQGFYIGDLSHQAFNWAHHKFGNEKAVVRFDIDDDIILNLNPKCLNYKQTCEFRNLIRKRNETRTYLFNENIIWAPVVGKNIPNFNQIKFESMHSQNMINSDNITKTKI